MFFTKPYGISSDKLLSLINDEYLGSKVSKQSLSSNVKNDVCRIAAVKMTFIQYSAVSQDLKVLYSTFSHS